MNADNVFISNKGEIRRYSRLDDGFAVAEKYDCFGRYDDDEDPIVSTMVLKGEHFLAGTYNGTATYIKNGTRMINNMKIHDSFKDVLAMDLNVEKMILGSSNFREIKLFTVTDLSLDVIAEVPWRARCLKMDNNCENILIGNICTDFHQDDGFITTLNALSLYDVATLTRRDLNCASSGVVDLVWHPTSQEVALTAHWGGDLRMFDLRSNADELRIEKQGTKDNNVSMAFDGHFGVVCGFRNTSEVCLYDLRNPDGAVKSYGQFKHPEMSAYLVEIIADPKQIFVVNNYAVQVCDFSAE